MKGWEMTNTEWTKEQEAIVTEGVTGEEGEEEEEEEEEDTKKTYLLWENLVSL